MTARATCQINPGGDDPRRVADALRIVDENLLTEYTPSSATDATVPGIKNCYDSSYEYIQTSKGVWRAIPHVAFGDRALPLAFRNRLLNSAFQINERGATSVANSTYCFDRWYVLTESGSVTVGALTDPETGRPNGIRLTQPDVAAKRIALAQVVESANIRDLRSAAVAMAARVRCSASQAIRMAILEWTGTADSVTRDVVNAWANSTFTAGQFFKSTTTNVIATGATTPSANTWTDLTQITGLFGASLQNAIVMVWTESTLAQNATLDIDQVQLEAGSACGTFARRAVEEDLALCQRYYEKLGGGSGFQRICGPFGTGLTESKAVWLFKVRKRATPTMTNPNGQSSSTDSTTTDQCTLTHGTSNTPAIWGVSATADAEL